MSPCYCSSCVLSLRLPEVWVFKELVQTGILIIAFAVTPHISPHPTHLNHLFLPCVHNSSVSLSVGSDDEEARAGDDFRSIPGSRGRSRNTSRGSGSLALSLGAQVIKIPLTNFYYTECPPRSEKSLLFFFFF